MLVNKYILVFYVSFFPFVWVYLFGEKCDQSQDAVVLRYIIHNTHIHTYIYIHTFTYATHAHTHKSYNSHSAFTQNTKLIKRINTSFNCTNQPMQLCLKHSEVSCFVHFSVPVINFSHIPKIIHTMTNAGTKSYKLQFTLSSHICDALNRDRMMNTPTTTKIQRKRYFSQDFDVLE